MMTVLALLASAAVAAGAPPKPRLAFLDLQNGPEVSVAVARTAGELLVVALSETGKFDVITRADIKAILGLEAQAQLLGCAEASCMVDLGGALGAAFLVTGSLSRLGGQLQLILSLIDVNRATVGRRLAHPVGSEAALAQGVKDAVQKLASEVGAVSGPADACQTPPCAREAIAAARVWWEENFKDMGAIVGIVPDGPYTEKLMDRTPARTFHLLSRIRARNGERTELRYMVRFKRVEGDWFFDEAAWGRLRSLPIVPDDPPEDRELEKILAEGYAAAVPGAKVLSVTPERFPDYQRAGKPGESASWSFNRMELTVQKEGKTLSCVKAKAKLLKAGAGWKYQHGANGDCQEVLDAAK